MSLTEAFLEPELTEGFAIIIFGILGLLLYGGIRLYSAFTIILWAITIIIFFGVVMYDLPIFLFYAGLICTAMLMALAANRYAHISNSRQNS